MSEIRPGYGRPPSGARVSANRTVAHNDVVRVIADFMRAHRAWSLKVWGNGMQRKGVPDLLFALPHPARQLAVFVAVEVKTGAGTLSLHQRAERAAIEAAGGLYVLAGSVDDVEAALVAAGLVVPCLT